MIMTKEYFNENVTMGIEFEEEDGHRFWKDCKLCEKNKVIKEMTNRGYYLSDVDLICKQDDEKVRYFLNLVDYNSQHNPKYKSVGYWKLIEIALDNWDY